MNTKTKEVTLFIQAIKWSWDRSFEIKVSTHQKKSDGDWTIVDLDTMVVNVEIPVLDEKVLVLAEVEQLQAVIKAEKADSYLRIVALEEKINSLMYLENKAEQ